MSSSIALMRSAPSSACRAMVRAPACSTASPMAALSCVEEFINARYILAEAVDTLFTTFIGTKQYKDIIDDVNIRQGTLFYEHTTQDLAPNVDPKQNDTQKG
ncbi:hypothetical protein Zm00014a_009571 [Zea mays]|uniref:Lipase class 3 family protein n=2 Tax=Zea mays TaxID=4577 RepID=A0A1D6Q715_MAIZE|nr:lipase class 3 family protein [Zea mays]PWZ27062.1 hypothetical protein Zm00014a_009571 [Zea mays]